MLTEDKKKILNSKSLEELAKENKELLDKIRQNAILLHMKKINEKHDKEEKKMSELLKKARKTFAFHAISNSPIDFIKVQKFIEEFWKKLGKNISKFIVINNFVYIKSKENLIISDREMGIDGTVTLEQINPKDIIKVQ